MTSQTAVMNILTSILGSYTYPFDTLAKSYILFPKKKKKTTTTTTTTLKSLCNVFFELLLVIIDTKRRANQRVFQGNKIYT